MYSDWVWLFFLANLTWLGILTFLVFRQDNFLKELFPKEGKRDIRKKFEQVIKSISDFKVDLLKVEDRVSELKTDGLKHIQKVELLRYNPYEDTGGDQSFTVALLDKEGSGFVVTSLHARSQTRVFAKPVIGGKSGKYQFSKEEAEVVEKAIKQNR